ncbi:MAG TPA: argininosuccinate lyase [Bacteroidia bacterium]
MKLWKSKIVYSDKVNKVDEFTVGNDKLFDRDLIAYDLIGSIAHTRVLGQCGLLTNKEVEQMVVALDSLLDDYGKGCFHLPESCEDVHSAVEFKLIDLIGEAGKKLHTARSRNDQSLLDIKLYLRDKSLNLLSETETLFNVLQDLGVRYKDVQMPGYTHSQLAMPSSVGLWLGAYAELLSDDAEYLFSTMKIIDRNPLGSAAGFGTSFPIDRDYSTKLLGFQDLHINSMAAQMYRVRTERMFANAMASFASTLSKLCSDVILFVNSNYRFIRFPEVFCTGSSIMPHKRNPDVFELIRAKCSELMSLPNRLTILGNNLQSGYHRDHQLSKELLFPQVAVLLNCLEMSAMAMAEIEITDTVSDFSSFPTLMTVESIEKLVIDGMSFREAYKKISSEVSENEYQPEGRSSYTHTGSIGNPGHAMVEERFRKVVEEMRREVKPVFDSTLF